MDIEIPAWAPHPQALSVLYANLELYALGQREAFTGTAGSVIERTNASGVRFYAHQFYDPDRKQRERYLAGPVGATAADAKAVELRERIAALKNLVPQLRLLGREGFHLADPRAYGVIAALHDHRLFEAGAMLVGSHAFGVIVNRLGVRTAPYTTDDVDIARREPLAFPTLPDKDFVEMLDDSGIEFAGIPGLDHKRPSTSFKQKGKNTFHVDLLVPSRDEDFPVIAVPELRAHAIGLPYLAYLVGESQRGAIMTREACCMVRVPLAERFAVHKLVVSQLRAGRNAKETKDLQQAALLLGPLAEHHSGAIADAVAALPKRALKHFRAALTHLDGALRKRAPRAWEELHAR